MNTNLDHLKLWQIDPFCPVDWRALDAVHLAAGESTNWFCDNDRHVIEFMRYLHAVHGDPEHAAFSEGWSAIRKAHEISRQSNPNRWHLEAELLTGRTDDEVAERCGLSRDTVSWFERLFFSVRESMTSSSYVMTEVIGRGLWTGFRDHELDRLWRAFGYCGGGHVLDSHGGRFLRCLAAGPARNGGRILPGIRTSCLGRRVARR